MKKRLVTLPAKFLRNPGLFRRPGGVNVGHFYDEVYGVNVHLLWPVTTAALQSYLDHHFPGHPHKDLDDDWRARCLEVTVPRGQVNVIALRRWSGTVDDIAVLVHECMHACSYTLLPRGVNLTAENDEPFAYYVDSLVRRCLEMLSAARRRKRRK